MSESTLAVTLTELRRVVGTRLGYGTTYPTAVKEYTHVDDMVRRGLRQFYQHPIIPEKVMYHHKWSFLEPWTTIVAWATTTGTVSGVGSYVAPSTTITATASKFYSTMAGHNFTYDTSSTDYPITSVGSSGTPNTAVTTAVVTGNSSGEASGDTFTITADGDYRLSDDFGGFSSRLMYSSTDGMAPIDWVAPERIQSLRTDYTSTGYPRYAAVAPVSHDSTGGQRWVLMLHPTPASDYTLNYRYRVLSNALVSTTNEYPHGGSEYGDALIASCEAVCELEVDGRHGGYWENFIVALQSAIRRDQAAHAPEYIGKNTRPDESGPFDYRQYANDHSTGTVTYNGVDYS